MCLKLNQIKINSTNGIGTYVTIQDVLLYVSHISRQRKSKKGINSKQISFPINFNLELTFEM